MSIFLACERRNLGDHSSTLEDKERSVSSHIGNNGILLQYAVRKRVYDRANQFEYKFVAG